MDDGCSKQLNPLHTFLEKSCDRIKKDLDMIVAAHQTLAVEYEKLYADKKQTEQQYNDLLTLFWSCFANLNNNTCNRTPNSNQEDQEQCHDLSTSDKKSVPKVPRKRAPRRGTKRIDSSQQVPSVMAYFRPSSSQ